MFNILTSYVIQASILNLEKSLKSDAMKLVMSSEFVKKQEYKLKKIKRSIYRTQREDRDQCNKRAKIECNFSNAMACLL